MADVTVTLNLRTKEALAQVKQAILEGTRETFVAMKGAAKANAHFGKYSTGATADSIDIGVKETEEGVRAALFTQSGHGGYVEVGTKNMKAEPFIRPAVDEKIGSLIPAIKEKIGG